MNIHAHPLIKWPGGKSREFNNIKDLIPVDINVYIEPFFGGGGIFFKTESQKAIINDINSNLMTFYELIKVRDKLFQQSLVQIANDWDNIDTIAVALFKIVKKYKNSFIDKSKIRSDIEKLYSTGKLPKLINGQEAFWLVLADHVINKLERIAKIEVSSKPFNDKDFFDQIVAVAKGAYYYYLRDEFKPRTKEEEIAQFFFIREYCFGSMFRFNSQGKFNIPYGGASYNDKSFHSKVDFLFSTGVVKLFQNTDIFCQDFRNFFRKINNRISEKDFIFFDPPYDTEFSEYDKNSFNRNDHHELAELFNTLKCRALIIIKKTGYINDLYKKYKRMNPNIIIEEYEKKYSYNMRGRNVRGVTHLLILNYKPNLSFKQTSLLGDVFNSTSFKMISP